MAFSTMQGALELGLIYAVLAFGVYISFRILDIPDLSVDGSFITGCAASAICAVNGHPLFGLVFAFLCGGGAGFMTGLLQTKCRIQPILSGILVMTGLYSINYKLMGNTPNISLFNQETVFTKFSALVGNELSDLILCNLYCRSQCVALLFSEYAVRYVFAGNRR